MSVADTIVAFLPILIPVLILVVFVLEGIFLVNDDEVGIVTKKMLGQSMPQGQVIARKGQIGVLADTLVPGLYWRVPIVYKIEKAGVVQIPENKIGIVESIDGLPLPKGRVVGDEVECNQFQDAERFLIGKGHKGPQAAILRPGTYRINTRAFNITLTQATRIPSGKLGVVNAQDGIPLPSNRIIAPVAKGSHNSYQNGQSFLDGLLTVEEKEVDKGLGYRGPQLDTLQPGLYYINPLLFVITIYSQAEVPPGMVAILRSNVGVELAKPAQGPEPVGSVDKSIPSAPVHDASETLLPLTDDKGVRGIYRNPIAPGTYNLNPLAFTPYLVPTSAVMIDWASSPPEQDKTDQNFQFGALGVTSKDGFPIAVEVRLVIRIDAANAAYIIARFGSVENLIQQIVHPVIDAEFRNNAGNKKALDFVQSRTELQKEALDTAKLAFARYTVEAQNLLISQIKMPAELMATQTAKEIAAQQQAQYQQQALAEEQRIAVQEKTARANMQPEVVKATLQVMINKNMADALIAQAEGIKQSTRIQAEGTKSKSQLEGEGQGIAAAAVGEGQARAIMAIGKAQGDAYKAQTEVIGSDRVALIRVVEAIRDGHVKVTPDSLIVMTGDQNGNSVPATFGAYLATLLAKAQQETKPAGETPPIPTTSS